jgi:hypothetical protein
MKKLITLAAAALIFTSCAVQKKSVVYKSLYEAKPASIIVMPPINKSTKVEAKELFYSSLAVPITLKGYYTMPQLLTMEILKEESAYDSEMFIDRSAKQIGDVFGVDAVLFTIIHDWQKMTILSQITVKIEYILKSTKDDQILFNRIGSVTLDQSQGGSGGGLAGALVSVTAGMISTALTREIVVGRKCNDYTLSDMPAGKYSPMFDIDGEQSAGNKEFRITIK